MKILSISVAMATYNSERTIERSLQSIRSQKYPQDHVEIILADGGSSDRTKEIAKKYEITWVSVDKKLQSAEYNKGVALAKAKNEIVAFIDHDNILPHNDWFARMTAPFKKYKEVIGVETLQYHYDPKSTLLDRYFALFGAGDPLVWYLGKTDRLSYIYDTYNLAGNARDVGDYYIVKFSPDNIPTIGANGFLVRRKELMEYAQATPGLYFDMDVNVDLINKGFNTYAFVKDSVLHLTGYGNVWQFLKRRMLYIRQYKLHGSQDRRYGQLRSIEKIKLGFVIVLCLTFFIPLVDSIRGWRKIHDSAWFLHPILCFSFVVLYSWVIMKHQIETYGKRFLAP